MCRFPAPAFCPASGRGTERIPRDRSSEERRAQIPDRRRRIYIIRRVAERGSKRQVITLGRRRASEHTRDAHSDPVGFCLSRGSGIHFGEVDWQESRKPGSDGREFDRPGVRDVDR